MNVPDLAAAHVTRRPQKRERESDSEGLGTGVSYTYAVQLLKVRRRAELGIK